MSLSSILALRSKILELKKQAETTDSRKEHAALLLEVKVKTERLLSICTHEYVICLCSEYKGSYSNDYEDGHGEVRLCLVCGISEGAYNEQHKILAKEPFARFETHGGYSGFDKITLDLHELIDYCKANGCHYFGKRWREKVEADRKAKQEEEHYQRCKATYRDRLLTDFAKEGVIINAPAGK
jgi:hypothetical protein